MSETGEIGFNVRVVAAATEFKELSAAAEAAYAEVRRLEALADAAREAATDAHEALAAARRALLQCASDGLQGA